MNPISQDAEPQPSPSSSLNRCLQLYWVKEITDADYFMHRGGGGKLSKCFNSCSLYEGKHELRHFCWTQLPSSEQGKTALHQASPKALRTLRYCSWVVTKSNSEEHHRQPPNTGLHTHCTGSARDNLCINHKLPPPKAAVPCTCAYSLGQPPKSNGYVATVSLWIPRLVFVQVSPSAAKHQELIHVTQALVTGFMWTRRGHLLAGHQADVSNLLLFPNFTAVFVSLSCHILQQLLQLLIPSTSRSAQTPCQILIIPSQTSQYCKLTWDHGINTHLDNIKTPTFFSCKRATFETC